MSINFLPKSPSSNFHQDPTNIFERKSIISSNHLNVGIPRKSLAPSKKSSIMPSSLFFPKNDIIIPSLKSTDEDKTSFPSLPNHRRSKSQLPEISNLDKDIKENKPSGKIQIPKEELTNLLQGVKDEILYEANKKDNFIEKMVEKHTLNNDRLVFTKDDIRDMLKEYKHQIKRDIIEDKKMKKTQELSSYENNLVLSQNYFQFQNLLWYYYAYNPEMYQQLLDEYNYRLHNQILGSLGLTENFSSKNMQIKPPPHPEDNGIGSTVKFNIGYDGNTNETKDSLNEIPKNTKPNIRKSLFIGQNPDLLASHIPPSHNRTHSLANENTRKSIYLGNNNEGNSRKSLYLKSGEGSKLSLAGKASLGDLSNIKGREELTENLKRIRKKSVMPTKEQREMLKKEDEENDRKSKVEMVIPNELVKPKKSVVDGSRKSLFVDKKKISINKDSVFKSNSNSSDGSDFDIYGIGNKQSSTPGLRLSKKPRSSNIEERDVIVDRYDIQIPKKEYEDLKFNDILTESLINFFLNFLQEKQNSLSPKKLASKGLRILYFPLLRNRNLMVSSKKDLTFQEKKLNSFDLYDKLLIPIQNENSNFFFIVVEMVSDIIRIYELLDEEMNAKGEILRNFEKYLNMITEKRREWIVEIGKISKIQNKKLGGLYLCRSIYLISQGITEMDNREKKTYEFKQKFLNVLLKISNTENNGKIENIIFDL